MIADTIRGAITDTPIGTGTSIITIGTGGNLAGGR
jgi:hypothetical protein